MSLPWPRWYQWSRAWAYRRMWLPELVAAVLVGLAAVILSHVPWGDRAVTSLFFEAAGEHHWPLSKQAPWIWFNRYAGIGTALMAGIALLLLFCSYFVDRLRRFRIHMLFLILVIAMGPGIAVNLLLKELWGRPRPKQVAEFGGWSSYRSIANPDEPGSGKSFPCGHCSASFAIIALYFIGRRHHRVLASLALALALILGGGMSAARVMSGAHFLSDALMAGVVVFLVAGFLYYAVLNIPAREDCPDLRAVSPGRYLLAGSGALVAAIALGGSLATPAHRTIWYDGGLTTVRNGAPVIRLELAHTDATLRFGTYDELAIRGFVEGFRGLGGSMKDELVWTPDRNSPTQLTYRLRKKGYFAEFRTAITAHVPKVGVSGLHIAARNVRLLLDEPPPPQLPIQIEMMGGQLSISDAWHPLLDRIALSNTVIAVAFDGTAPERDNCCP